MLLSRMVSFVLKCEIQMQEDFLKATKNKVYRLNHYDEVRRIVAYSFIKNLNNTLKAESTVINYVCHDYVLLYTVYIKRELENIKIVDFAISMDIDVESDSYTITDCYVTTWLENKES